MIISINLSTFFFSLSLSINFVLVFVILLKFLLRDHKNINGVDYSNLIKNIYICILHIDISKENGRNRHFLYNSYPNFNWKFCKLLVKTNWIDHMSNNQFVHISLYDMSPCLLPFYGRIRICYGSSIFSTINTSQILHSYSFVSNMHVLMRVIHLCL